MILLHLIHGLQWRAHHMITLLRLILIRLLPVRVVHLICIHHLWPRCHPHTRVSLGGNSTAYAVEVALILLPTWLTASGMLLLSKHPIGCVEFLQLTLNLWVQPWMIDEVSDPLRDDLSLLAEEEHVLN